MRTYYLRGISNLNIKKYKSAISDFIKAIELSPKSDIFDELVIDDCHYNLGRAYFKLGEKQQAIINFKIASSSGHKEAQDALLKMGEKW
ncbi:MAG: tetratricopeptide repeat protein [Thermodesulfovibrionales bacterium]|nr:tetratricopeptide repeat protein [Thermodesulfovibrionales bacterium]